MKFINFNTENDRKCLTSEQMAFLILCENHSFNDEEIHVCLISNNFENTNANRIAVIIPILYKTATGKIYNYQTFTMDGANKPKGGVTQGGHFGMYETIEQALHEANVCYGASTEEEIGNRLTKYSRKNFSKDK